MVRRLGFRHMLPVLLLLIQATIFLWDWAHEGCCFNAPKPPMVWEVAKPIPIAMKMTAVLNLPAWFMSIPFKIAFPTMSDTGAILAAIPFRRSGMALVCGLTDWRGAYRCHEGNILRCEE